MRDTSGPFLDQLLKLQFDEWLQDWALIRQDKNTMAHSLEYRLPFLDHRLIELAFRMPPHLKVRGNEDKWIERKLADEAFAKMPRNKPGHRPKIPFFLPLDFFFEHPEVKALQNRLLAVTPAVPALTTLAATVGTYHTEMKTLRDAQQAAEQTVDNNAALLEIQRLAAAAMMYKNLGRLMEKFSDTPVRVEDFYDMNYIRDGAAAPPEDVPPPVPPPVP